MKVNTLKTYPETAEVWVIANQDDTTGAVVFAYERTIPCRFMANRSAVSLHTNAEGIKRGDKIKNIRDINNVDVADAAEWVVGGVTPVINVYGFAEDLRYNLVGGK